jgi:ATP phosphoribosyltransferase
MKLTFATGNSGKLREASEILGEGFELVSLAQVGILEDIPETGDTLRENSIQKAEYLYENSKLSVNWKRTQDGVAVTVDVPEKVHGEIELNNDIILLKSGINEFIFTI